MVLEQLLYLGYYEDIMILDSCDSILGVIVFTYGALSLVLCLVAYTYTFHRLLTDVRRELCESKWVYHMLSLDSNLRGAELEFQVGCNLDSAGFLPLESSSTLLGGRGGRRPSLASGGSNGAPTGRPLHSSLIILYRLFPTD